MPKTAQGVEVLVACIGVIGGVDCGGKLFRSASLSSGGSRSEWLMCVLARSPLVRLSHLVAGSSRSADARMDARLRNLEP